MATQALAEARRRELQARQELSEAQAQIGVGGGLLWGDGTRLRA